METGSRVDQLLARAVQQQVAEQRAWREAMEAMGSRVGALEAAIDELRGQLAELVEASAQAGVAQGLEVVAAQLRRQVSDLGRLIVNDLGRLPQIIQDAVGREAPPLAPPSPGATGTQGGPTEAEDSPQGSVDLLRRR